MTLEEQLAAAADDRRPLPFDTTDLAAGARKRRRNRRLATRSFAVAVILAATGGAIALSQGQDDDAPPVASTTTVARNGTAAVLTGDRWVPVETNPSPIAAILPILDFDADGTLVALGAASESPCSVSATWRLVGEAIVLDSTTIQSDGGADCSEASGTAKGALIDLLGDGPATLTTEDPPLISVGGTARNEATTPPGAVQLFGAFLQQFKEIGDVGRDESTPGRYRTPEGTLVELDADGTFLVGACAPGLWAVSDGTFTATPDPDDKNRSCDGEQLDITRILEAGGPIRTTEDGRLWLDSAEGTLRLDPDEGPQ